MPTPIANSIARGKRFDELSSECAGAHCVRPGLRTPTCVTLAIPAGFESESGNRKGEIVRDLLQSASISEYRRRECLEQHCGEAISTPPPFAHCSREWNFVGFQFHSGVIGSALRPAAPDWNELIPPFGHRPRSAQPAASLLFAGDRISDPENVGALIRIAAAFGADGVILGAGSADPFSQFQCCGTTLSPQAEELAEIKFSARTILVFGNEYEGISPSVAEICELLVTISMHRGIDSLNVAVCAGIFAWQYRQQCPAPVACDSGQNSQ